MGNEEKTDPNSKLDEFSRMERLAAKVFSVPKEEIDKREKDWRAVKQAKDSARQKR